MSEDLVAIARDNTIRVSPLKLANVARSIVDQKASKALNQLKFSNKRINLTLMLSNNLKIKKLNLKT